MPSLSRTVLVIGTLAASVACAQAGDKAAFNAPVRDAMPDITPITAAAPEAPVAAVIAATPNETRPANAKRAKRLAAKHGAPTTMVVNPQHDAAHLASAVPMSGATGVPASSTTGTTAGAPADKVAELESKSAGIGSVAVSSADEPRQASAPQGSAATPPVAVSNTETASQTPGPPPTAKPDGPREHASGTVADLVAKHALANGVPVKLAQAVVRIESRGNAHASNAGALGLMQIKFGTARAAGFSGPAVGLFVADTNLHYGMKILGDAYRAAGGDTCGALMRYQSGHLATRMNRANALYCSRARAIMAGA